MRSVTGAAAPPLGGAYSLFTASISTTPPRPGVNVRPIASQPSAADVTRPCATGGMYSALDEAVTWNRPPDRRFDSWLRVHGRPCPNGVWVARDHRPARFAAASTIRPSGAVTRQISRR